MKLYSMTPTLPLRMFTLDDGVFLLTFLFVKEKHDIKSLSLEGGKENSGREDARKEKKEQITFHLAGAQIKRRDEDAGLHTITPCHLFRYGNAAEERT